MDLLTNILSIRVDPDIFSVQIKNIIKKKRLEDINLTLIAISLQFLHVSNVMEMSITVKTCSWRKVFFGTIFVKMEGGYDNNVVVLASHKCSDYKIRDRSSFKSFKKTNYLTSNICHEYKMLTNFYLGFHYK